jgi:hypothetical protein
MPNVFVVGGSGVGRFHARAVNDLLIKNKVKSVRVSVTSLESLGRLYAQFRDNKILFPHDMSGVELYGNYEKMLSQHSEPGDIAIVSTPNWAHYACAKFAMEKGCHVLVEKPFTMTYAEAQGLVALADKNEVRLGVNLQLAHPMLKEYFMRKPLPSQAAWESTGSPAKYGNLIFDLLCHVLSPFELEQSSIHKLCTTPGENGNSKSHIITNNRDLIEVRLGYVSSRPFRGWMWSDGTQLLYSPDRDTKKKYVDKCKLDGFHIDIVEVTPEGEYNIVLEGDPLDESTKKFIEGEPLITGKQALNIHKIVLDTIAAPLLEARLN